MRVAVGMSGGVDSSVCALLLKEKGYDVVGVTLRFHTLETCETETGKNICCSPEDVRDAARVSQRLGIPHLTFSWEEIFSSRVIDYFIREYLSGNTPNPCAICNREVKTGFFARYLKKVAGIDFLATGHYARILEDKRHGRIIARGRDRSRDQSYFLALLRREDIALLMFPLGDMTKEEVRRIAAERGLEVANKRDSQEVCFLMGKSPGEYLQKRVGRREGYIKHISGKILGKHGGIFNFTVGQRRGLGISYGKPIYVLDIVASENTVVVGEEEYLYRDEIWVGNLNLHSPMDMWQEVYVQIRYRHLPVRVRDIDRVGGLYRVRLVEKVKGVAPGQVAAFYENELLLGGGIIEREPT
jgi:tRNA-specific 2-thiouridylase